MKKIYYLLLVVLLAGCGIDQTPHEGDIIFQTTTRPEATIIHEALQSSISHCGVIIEKEDGSLYVLEVADHVRLVPFNQFISSGYHEQYTIKRAKLEKDTKIDFQKYLGCSGDPFLRLDEKRFYSSELVYTIFKNQLGIELCTPRTLDSYNVENIKGYLQSRHLMPKQPVVAPTDLFNSPLLETVRDTYKKEESSLSD